MFIYLKTKKLTSLTSNGILDLHYDLPLRKAGLLCILLIYLMQGVILMYISG